MSLLSRHGSKVGFALLYLAFVISYVGALLGDVHRFLRCGV
jgi:hypothetical protein